MAKRKYYVRDRKGRFASTGMAVVVGKRMRDATVPIYGKPKALKTGDGYLRRADGSIYGRSR